MRRVSDGRRSKGTVDYSITVLASGICFMSEEMDMQSQTETSIL